jgi:hypothetical protein
MCVRNSPVLPVPVAVWRRDRASPFSCSSVGPFTATDERRFSLFIAGLKTQDWRQIDSEFCNSHIQCITATRLSCVAENFWIPHWAPGRVLCLQTSTYCSSIFFSIVRDLIRLSLLRCDWQKQRYQFHCGRLSQSTRVILVSSLVWAYYHGEIRDNGHLFLGKSRFIVI